MGEKVHLETFLERERNKPDLGDFTLGEYTEKVIVYGFLMVSESSNTKLLTDLVFVQ